MAGTARSNNPDGSSPVDPDRLRLLPSVGKVRELQRKLEGSRDECLDHIERVWTDMRPLSVRRALDVVD